MKGKVGLGFGVVARGECGRGLWGWNQTVGWIDMRCEERLVLKTAVVETPLEHRSGTLSRNKKTGDGSCLYRNAVQARIIRQIKSLNHENATQHRRVLR